MVVSQPRPLFYMPTYQQPVSNSYPAVNIFMRHLLASLPFYLLFSTCFFEVLNDLQIFLHVLNFFKLLFFPVWKTISSFFNDSFITWWVNWLKRYLQHSLIFEHFVSTGNAIQRTRILTGLSADYILGALFCAACQGWIFLDLFEQQFSGNKLQPLAAEVYQRIVNTISRRDFPSLWDIIQRTLYPSPS